MSEVTLYLTTRLQLDRAGAHPLARSGVQKCSVCVRREAESEWESKAERERKRAREKERDGPAGRGGGASGTAWPTSPRSCRYLLNHTPTFRWLTSD